MIKLIDILRELNIKKKDILGQGLEHDVYPSSDPNKVIKVGETRSVRKWLKDFESRPDLFPIIYKKSVKKEDPSVAYVVMEKLDTEQFDVDFDVLDSILDDQHLGVLQAITIGEHNEKRWDEIHGKIKEQDPEIADFFTNLYNNVVQTKKFKSREFGQVYDFHKGQFGYDKKGNIKMLDY